jgi:hypothetical protein
VTGRKSRRDIEHPLDSRSTSIEAEAVPLAISATNLQRWSILLATQAPGNFGQQISHWGEMACGPSQLSEIG